MTRHPGAPDIVYVVKQAERNEELRYSLRSLKNVPHRKVWIAGYRPTWVARTVGHIPVPKQGSKYESAAANWRAACEHPHVGPTFYMFNDDFFAMKYMKRVPVFHWGTMAKVERYYRGKVGNSVYVQNLKACRDLITKAGFADEPLSYDLHVPLPVQKDLLLKVIHFADEAGMPRASKRTLYGNAYRIGGTYLEDPKVTPRSNRVPRGGLFLSTNDAAFKRGYVGRLVQRTFHQPGPYELWQRTPAGIRLS